MSNSKLIVHALLLGEATWCTSEGRHAIVVEGVSYDIGLKSGGVSFSALLRSILMDAVERENAPA